MFHTQLIVKYTRKSLIPQERFLQIPSSRSVHIYETSVTCKGNLAAISCQAGKDTYIGASLFALFAAYPLVTGADLGYSIFVD